MIFIVAGSFEQYRRHIELKGYNAQEYRYVSSPNILRGITDIQGFFIGTWQNRPDIEQIKEIIQLSKNRAPAPTKIFTPTF